MAFIIFALHFTPVNDIHLDRTFGCKECSIKFPECACASVQKQHVNNNTLALFWGCVVGINVATAECVFPCQ